MKTKEFLIVAAVTVLLFILGVDAAYTQRGYKAVGGEYLLLTIPFFYWQAKVVVKEIKSECKEIRQNDREVEVLAASEQKRKAL